MNEIFVKKYWDEDDILFYIHFIDGIAVRQIEVIRNHTVYLDANNPIQDESMLYDQKLNELDLETKDFITKEEFNIAWKK